MASYAEKQENTIHNEKKMKSIKIDAERMQMIELLDKDIKTVITKILTISKKVEEIISMLMKGIEDTKKKKEQNQNSIDDTQYLRRKICWMVLIADQMIQKKRLMIFKT